MDHPYAADGFHHALCWVSPTGKITAIKTTDGKHDKNIVDRFDGMRLHSGWTFVEVTPKLIKSFNAIWKSKKTEG